MTYILNDDIVLLLCSCLGGYQSFNARQMEWLNSSFESLEDARDRVNRAAAEEDTGQRKKKNHFGDYSRITWNKQVEGYHDDKEVNWSDIARRYQVTDSKRLPTKNGKQIAKGWLVTECVNVNRFQPHMKRKLQ